MAIKILNKKQIRQEEENVRLLREKRLAEIMKKSSAAIAAITSSPDTVVDETDIIGKMEKEVQLMMRLDHPNIVRVYEIFDEDEETFIIM